MKPITIIIAVSVFILSAICFMTLHVERRLDHIENEIKNIETHIDTVEKTTLDLIFDAICVVESNNNPYAVGSNGDCGIAQLRPIYVAEVNRICKSNIYSLSDRFSPVRTKEMFCIIQTKKNPNTEIDKAIKLHNPNATNTYKQKVIKEYNKLINKYNNEVTRK